MLGSWNFRPHSNLLHVVSHLIACTRRKLLEWKSIGLSPIEIEIDRIESSILEAETNNGLSANIDFSLPDLTIFYNRLSALHRQNSTKWAQRARLMWVQCGDNSTSFFHIFVRFCSHYNSISHISDLNGSVFTDQHEISQVFTNYFTNLWTAPSNKNYLEIFNALPNDLPHIFAGEGDLLVSEVTKKEVFQAL